MKPTKIQIAAEVIYQLTEIKAVQDFSEVQDMAIAYLSKVGLQYSSTEILRDEEDFFDKINVRNISPNKVSEHLVIHLQDVADTDEQLSDERANEMHHSNKED